MFIVKHGELATARLRDFTAHPDLHHEVGDCLVYPARFKLWRAEPPRVLRRLQPLREWSHEQVNVKSVFPGSPRARGSHGAGAS
ncbi:MAG: hypothetical protein AB7I68_01815, partial [Porticoccaceae bacterium]